MDCHNCTIGDEFELAACHSGVNKTQNRVCSNCTTTNCVSSGNFQQACTHKCTTAIEQGGFGFDSCDSTDCACNAGSVGALTGGRYVKSESGQCASCNDCEVNEFESVACQGGSD